MSTFQRGFLSQPAVRRLLDTWPAPVKPSSNGPAQCCSQFASVITRADGTKRFECGFCGQVWDVPNV